AAVLEIVEFAMHDAGARAHALHISGADDAAVAGTRFTVAHAVFVGEFSFKHIADDFHVAVAMGAKAVAGSNRVVVDDEQIAMALMLDVEIASERKTVGALQPATVGGPAAFF